MSSKGLKLFILMLFVNFLVGIMVISVFKLFLFSRIRGNNWYKKKNDTVKFLSYSVN